MSRRHTSQSLRSDRTACSNTSESPSSKSDWYGTIPAHWEIKPLKRAVTLNPESLPEDTSPDLSFRYVDISNVNPDGSFGEGEIVSFGRAPSRARRLVAEGDCVISTVRTYLKAIARIGPEAPGLVFSTGFAVLRPSESVSGSFLFFALQAEPFIQRVVAHSEGIGYPVISPSALGSLPIVLPSLPEQTVIAVFLDRETTRIDELMAKKQRLIGLLEEKRTTLVNDAVTRGLDRDMETKDSGLEWIPKVPASWKVKRNKILFRERDERSVAGEEELLTVSHITGVTRRSEKQVTMIEAETHEGYKLCKAGDLVINTMWAWMGALGVAPEDGMVSPSYNVYRPQDSDLVPSFIDFLVRTPAYVSELTRFSKGVWKSRLRLYPEGFFEIMTALPPADEQAEIVTLLGREVGRIDRLIAKVHEAIERLREYRTALISAAVTGKIDVREES